MRGDDVTEEHIDVLAESIPGSRQLLPMPSMNPSLGGTLEVVGLSGYGFLLVFTDGVGTRVWSRLLLGRTV